MNDEVNHPTHYNSHPSGIECIEIVRHFTFNSGNVIKRLWRNGLKDGEPSVKELKKAAWYLADEIGRLERSQGDTKKKLGRIVDGWREEGRNGPQ